MAIRRYDDIQRILEKRQGNDHDSSLMKTIPGKRLCKILEDKGWQLTRITGSHHIYTKSGEVLRITVPVHGNRDLKIGLLKAIMKMAGITEDEL